jgi:hypothetical protein
MNASAPKADTIQGVDSMSATIASPLHLAPVEDKATHIDFAGDDCLPKAVSFCSMTRMTNSA